MKTLTTQRLILRNFEQKDYDDMYEYLSQRKDDKFEAYPDITYENADKYLKAKIGSDDFVAIELKETGKVIGNVFFAQSDFEARELGYIINKDYQRKGYASEAVKEVLRYAFENGLHRVYAECDPDNTCSWKFLESLGFLREGLLRQNIYFGKDENGNPNWNDSYIYGMLNPKEEIK